MFKSREIIKQEARTFLEKNYVQIILVTLLLSVITGSFRTEFRVNVNTGSNVSQIQFGNGLFSFPLFSFALSMIALFVALAVLAVAILIGIFVKNPLEYSCKSWLRHQTDERDFSVFDVFRDPDYSRIVKTMFLRDLHVFIGFLCLIIPGFINLYKYYFVPQLLEDHPELSPQEILDLCEDMTMGRKEQLFIFDLSFILWDILSGITAGLAGIFFVNPWKELSRQLLYLDWQNNGVDPYYVSEENTFQE
ncbi:MAG: DUF975 family protein [Solobacterium sp.]|nr:DUF975 family protein [Solobacterium sp.]